MNLKSQRIAQNTNLHSQNFNNLFNFYEFEKPTLSTVANDAWKTLNYQKGDLVLVNETADQTSQALASPSSSKLALDSFSDNYRQHHVYNQLHNDGTNKLSNTPFYNKYRTTCTQTYYPQKRSYTTQLKQPFTNDCLYDSSNKNLRRENLSSDHYHNVFNSTYSHSHQQTLFQHQSSFFDTYLTSHSEFRSSEAFQASSQADTYFGIPDNLQCCFVGDYSIETSKTDLIEKPLPISKLSNIVSEPTFSLVYNSAPMPSAYQKLESMDEFPGIKSEHHSNVSMSISNKFNVSEGLELNVEANPVSDSGCMKNLDFKVDDLDDIETSELDQYLDITFK